MDLGPWLFAALLALVPSARAQETRELFDGASLAGWEGEADFWSVEQGEIVGRFRPQTEPDDERIAKLIEENLPSAG